MGMGLQPSGDDLYLRPTLVLETLIRLYMRIRYARGPSIYMLLPPKDQRTDLSR